MFEYVTSKIIAANEQVLPKWGNRCWSSPELLLNKVNVVDWYYKSLIDIRPLEPMHNREMKMIVIPSAPILAIPMLYVAHSFVSVKVEKCLFAQMRLGSVGQGRLFGRLAFVAWVLCACQCALLAALAILCPTEKKLLIEYAVLSFTLLVLVS